VPVSVSPETTGGRAPTLPMTTVMMKSSLFSTSLNVHPNDAEFNKQCLCCWIGLDCVCAHRHKVHCVTWQLHS
jgi:hypothetical protein